MAWLTMSVQAGFVAGALGSGLVSLPGRIRADRFFRVSAFAAAACTGAIALFAVREGPRRSSSPR